MSEAKLIIPQSSPLFEKVLRLIEELAEEPVLTGICGKCHKDWSHHYFHSNEYRCPA